MTELEKIAYAKSFIDKLAQGVNPIDDTQIPDGDIVNNVRLSRCFFYVSDILRQVIDNGGITKQKRAAKIPFSIPANQLEKFEYSSDPIPVSEIAKRINSMIDNEYMMKLSYRQINQWLINIGMLRLLDFADKNNVKRPTQEGSQIGIGVESRAGRYGEYQVVLYNIDAQHFIIDNLDAVAATEAKKGKTNNQALQNNGESDD